MSRKTGFGPLLEFEPVKYTEKSADKRRLASQAIVDSIPVQIDAIKKERENAALELRAFVVDREKGREKKQLDAEQLTRRGRPDKGIVRVPRLKVHSFS